MSRPVSIQDTITVHPTGIASDYSYASISDTKNGYTDATSTTYSTINLTTGQNAETYVYYTFNLSEIPDGATIDSISCSAKIYISTTNSSRITSRQAQLFSGSTAKGSAATISNSTTAFTVTPGSWTRSELQNARIRVYAQRGSSNTTTNYYFRFYGTTLTVNYSISGTMYTIAATSNISEVEVDPSTQEVFQGGAGTIRFDADDIYQYSVTDNDTDILESLEQHQIPSGGTDESVLGTYTLVSGGFNGSGASYFQGLVGKGIDNTKTTSNYYSSGSGTIAVFTYNFSFPDVPSDATINRVYCEVNGHAESTSNSNEYMCAQLYNGSSAISSELNFKSIGTSNSTQTLEATTLPSASQVNNLKLQCRLGYYGGAINGATCYVVYTMSKSGYYWTYTIANIGADHVIVVDVAGPYIPDPEDPTKTYHSLTISSINAITDPHNGTTRVENGTTQVITISPTDPQLTLALDNGVDITDQLVGGIPTNIYTVTTQVSGASYGFNLNSNTNYYVSTNNGVNKSASVARVNFDFESDCLVTISYINYAETQYDYGLFGKIDTTVATDGLTASSGSSTPSDSLSNYYHICNGSNDSTSSVQTLTYTIPAGTHYIDIKYGKDDATNEYNDSLQWKITSIEPTSAGGDYTYTLTNISQKHSLIFVFGNVNYYFIESSLTNNNGKIFPDGQQVKLEGDPYLINIVPNDISATVTITDNTIDVSNLLEKTEGTDKQGNPAVSYSYKLTNIQQAHTLLITIGGGTTALYFKENNSWRIVTAAYKKVNGSWIQITDLTTVFDSTLHYVKGN